ncbi:uncharacterized protein LOC120881575 [Oryx dammah]|uniref:uncharacterized protein LOC120881575 n=1 Tax=Oryx dammah TaxID=59534 RepID=UPI001A9ABF45|nr:uncharacterized protein LOC120881575 [Oryx dammah]
MQVPNQEEVKQQQLPQQQQQEEQLPQQQLMLLPEQPQQYNTSGENQVMHVFMPNQPSFSVLHYNDGFMSLPLQPPPPPSPPMFIPIQMVAEQQPSAYYHVESLNASGHYHAESVSASAYYCAGNLSASGYYHSESLNASGHYRIENFNASGYYRAENFNGPENGRFRFFPENLHQPCMNLFSMTDGPGPDAIYSANLPQTTTITHNPQLVTLETPQDYVCLWQQAQDPQSYLYQAVQMNNWAPNEQATVGQATCAQVAPTEQVQHSSGLQAVQASGNNGPNQLNSCMSSQQSHLNP